MREIDPAGAECLLIYHWLPIAGYEESEPDLVFISGLREDPGIMVIPVQFDPGARNHAQTIVNDLDVSLTVFLGDSVLRDYLWSEVLPVTLLLSPGTEARTTGFGGPERLLTGSSQGN
jgi:hypothetical protein